MEIATATRSFWNMPIKVFGFKGELSHLEFEIFSGQSVLAKSFTRHGGVSCAPFSSLNIGTNVGDDLEAVSENRRRVQETLSASSLSSMQQVHGKCVSVASEASPECDALITNERGRALVVAHADCQAALFYDPIAKAIGAAHAGWRGNVLGMYGELVKAMHHAYGTKAESLLVAISPSLGPKSAEFVNWRKEFPPHFEAYRVGDVHFDLWQQAEDELAALGVLRENIEIAKVDTASSQDFFSYRREKTTGRLATGIMLI